MAWPCRAELWGDHLGSAKAQYAGVANAVAAFEPVVMLATGPAEAAEASSHLTGDVEVIEMALDDSWVRDNGPIFVLGPAGERAGVHFRFNAWGEKYAGWGRDEAAGGLLAELYGDVAYEAPIVLEGGSVLIDGEARVVTTEQCLLAPNRNPTLGRADIERALRDYLGASEVIWLGQGLLEDRDTDGHVDLIAAFTDSGELLLQSCPADSPDQEPMAENLQRANNAGLRVIEFPVIAHGEVGGQSVVHSYLNLYLCNGGAIVPLVGDGSPGSDEEALERLRRCLPGREVVGVPSLMLSFGGGGPHCVTQQVPARAALS
jgi:agmatine deiminase